jgi:hypothetical protein
LWEPLPRVLVFIVAAKVWENRQKIRRKAKEILFPGCERWRVEGPARFDPRNICQPGIFVANRFI